jgi:hypothetical protein
MDRALHPGSRLWQGLFAACLAGASAMALLPHPPRLVTISRYADKIEHMIAFGVLAALAMLAFPAFSRLRLLLALSLFGAGIEIVQAIPGLHRDSDPVDWIADTAVVAAVVVAALLMRRGAARGER